MRELLGADELTAVLGGAGPDGVAVLRFRRSVWTDGPDCYLEELPVATKNASTISRQPLQRAHPRRVRAALAACLTPRLASAPLSRSSRVLLAGAR